MAKPIALLLPLLVTQSLAAQQPAESELDKARVQYETTMAGVREKVLAEIRDAKSDVKTRLEWRDRFLEEGQWPPIEANKPLADLEQVVVDARVALASAYDRCLEALYEDVKLSRCIRGEVDIWQELNDLPKWRPIEPPSAAPRREGLDRISILGKLSPPFRLQVAGRATPGQSLTLQLPGSTDALTLVVNGEGMFRAVVSVSAEGELGCDLGVIRVPGVKVAATDMLMLFGTAVTVTCAEWKPAPIDAIRLGREASARLEAAKKEQQESNAVTKAVLDKQIAALEKKKPTKDRAKVAEDLARADRNVASLTAQIQRLGGRGASDLQTDLASWKGKAEKRRKALDALDAEIKKIDDEIAGLRTNAGRAGDGR